MNRSGGRGGGGAETGREETGLIRTAATHCHVLHCVSVSLRMFLSIVKCLCFAGGRADVHSKIIASLIKGPPHGASSRCQAICSEGRETESALHWRMQ